MDRNDRSLDLGSPQLDAAVAERLPVEAKRRSRKAKHDEREQHSQLALAAGPGPRRDEDPALADATVTNPRRHGQSAHVTTGAYVPVDVNHASLSSLWNTPIRNWSAALKASIGAAATAGGAMAHDGASPGPLQADDLSSFVSTTGVTTAAVFEAASLLSVRAGDGAGTASPATAGSIDQLADPEQTGVDLFGPFPPQIATLMAADVAQANTIHCCGTCGYINCPTRLLDQAPDSVLQFGQLPGSRVPGGADFVPQNGTFGSSTSAPMPSENVAPMAGWLPGGGGETASGTTPGQIGILSGPVTTAESGLTAEASSNLLVAEAATTNPIAVENQKTGNPESQWGIDGAGDSNIEGFATDISVNHGQAINFKIDTNSNNYRIDIYRLGYYGGMGARKVDTIQHTGLQNQPAPLRDATTGLVDAGNWAVSASWNVPADAVSGVYIAKLVRQDGTAGENHIPFIVRDDSSHSDIVFQTSDTTWQAYNGWGGANFYGGDGPATGQGAGRAYAVSYNRPIATRGGVGSFAGPQDYLFGAEYAAISWLEQNGYDVSYMAGVDVDRYGSLLLNHELYLDVGHDEYWSGQQRANVEAARDAGVNLAFWSGNEVYWRTRWGNSISLDATAYRTLISYKETWAPNSSIDPSDQWTGTFRDPRLSPPAIGGGSPENSLTGTMFQVDDVGNNLQAITVPYDDANLRFWRNTSVANLQPGQTATLTKNYLGYEWDEAPDNGFDPAGLVRLSSTTLPVSTYLLDYGNTTGNGTSTHNLTLYRAPSGALVFGAGTVYWAWGLSANHDLQPTATDARVQQAMINLFADMRDPEIPGDMGIQPATLQSGTAATPSTDETRPTSVINPLGAVTTGQVVTVSGTASDVGGVIAGVEVSTDNGASWHPAVGDETWTYNWSPQVAGTYTIRSRAVDDSINLETPSVGRTITVTGPAYLTLFPGTATPAVVNVTDSSAVELGVKFRTAAPGAVNGIRFYKSSQDTGIHTGELWSSTGTQLATVTFVNETTSGWQTATFSSPVTLTVGATYTASYHTNTGHYSTTANYFTTDVTSGPLTAPASGNGVYRYGSTSLFPTSTFMSENYWVDVTFAPESSTTLIDTNVAANAVNESAVIGTPVGITATDSVAGVVTYSLSNSAGGRFTIGPSTGVVTVAGAIDRETAGASLAIEVTGTSSSGTHLATFNIAIDDVDEFDITPLGDANSTANGVALGAATGTPVGITALATDADATTNAVTYSLSENAGGRFAIGATTGIVTVANGALIDTVTTHQITVLATSADGSTASQTFSIPVTAQPTTISLFDPQAPVTGTLTNDNASVELGVKFQSSKAGTITALRYYRAAADADDTDVRQVKLWGPTGTTPLATVTITSSPGASGWQVGTLSPLDSVAIIPTTTYIVSYHTDNNYFSQGGFFNNPYSSPFGLLSSPESPFDNSSGTDGNGLYAYSPTPIRPTLTYHNENYWADVTFAPESSTTLIDTNAAANAVNESAVIGTPVGITATDSVAGVVTYSLSNSAGGRFTIGPSTGVVTVAGAIDRETAGASLAIEVTGTSSSGTHLATFNIAIDDVDEFDITPLGDANSTANGVALGAATGTPVGITALATDADATTNAVTYSLSENAGGRFAIGATTGIVTVANGALIDTVTTHQITVLATSADGSTASQTFNIAVTTNNSPTISNLAVSATSISFVATDVDNATLSLASPFASAFSNPAITSGATTSLTPTAQTTAVSGTLRVTDGSGATADVVGLYLGTSGNNTATAPNPTAPNAMYGFGGSDALTGGAAADSIFGGAGADTMVGGPGADIYVVDNTGDVVTENASEGLDTVQAAVTYTLAANVENLTLTGTGNINGTGNALGNVLTGNSGANVLIGLDGSDTLNGGAGNDTYRYASTAEAAVGENIVEIASGGTDTLRTTATADLSALTVNGGADLQGANSLEGIERILIQGGATATFSGAQLTGNSIAINESAAGTTNLVINVASGATNTFANLTFNAFSGGDAFDNGADTITINGAAGAENIIGTRLADVVTGGAGVDQFRLRTDSGSDTITDYTDNTDKFGFLEGSLGGVNFANTTPSAVGTALSASDFDIRASIAGITANDDNQVVQINTAQTSAQITGVNGGAGTNVYVILFNSDTLKGEIWFDTNWSNQTNRNKIATLSNVTTLFDVTQITNADIVVYDTTLGPAGVAGSPINLGLTDYSGDHVGQVDFIIAGVPSGWILSEGTDNGNGTWTVQTSNPSSLTITAPDTYAGSVALNVTVNKVDGSIDTLTDNVEAYAPRSPIFAWSGDDNLSGSGGSDVFVLGQPIGNNTMHSFDVAHDKVDLIGFDDLSSFVDVQTRLSENSNGDAVVMIAEGQSITFNGVSAASLTADNFVFNVDTVMDNANSIVIGDNALLPLAGTVNNNGTIELTSMGGQTILQVLANGLTLEGGGHVDFSDGNGNIIVGTTPDATLTNVDNTISGAGRLGEGQLTLHNQGTIIASGGNALTIDTGANAVVNSGTLEAIGSGGLVIHSDIANSGLLWANGGNITIDGNVSGTGSARIDGVATFEMGGAFGQNVTLDAGASATLKIDHAVDFSGAVAGFDGSDVLDLADLAFGSNTTLGYAANSNNTGGTLTVSDGTHTANIALLGQYTAGSFVMSADGFGGTLIHDLLPATQTHTLTQPQHA